MLKWPQPALLSGLGFLSLQVLSKPRAFIGYLNQVWEAIEQPQAPKATCSLVFSILVHPDVNSGSALKL